MLGGGELTPFDEEVLQRVLPRVMAWERVHNPEYSGGLTMGQFYDLLISAGYDKEVALKAANKRGWQRLDAGMKM